MSSAKMFLNLFRDVETTNFSAGEHVFREGDRGELMFVVIEGDVQILDGSTVLEIAGPGSIIGELALIDDGPRSAAVIAKTDVKLVPVNRRRFEFMVQETPFFALTVMKILADRLRATNAKLLIK
jgi:CRP/FNR family transcriptional regulator, cyclic AMP receptor protein